MKIALLEFPISLEGGITTFKINLASILEKRGFKVDKFHITLNKQKKPNIQGYTKILGFKTKEWLEEYYNTLQDYDYLLFATNCPHLLKDYTDTDWKKCYDISKPKIAWIHDSYFEKYYPWFRDIPLKYQVKLVCPSNYHYNSLAALPAMKRIIPNILIYKDSGLYTNIKEDIIVDPNEFKSVKYKHILVERAKDIQGSVILFGHTDTIYYSNYKSLFESPDIKCLGWQPLSVIYDYMKKAKVVVDLSVRNNSTTMWDTVLNEAVNYGAVLVTQSDICPTFQFKRVKSSPTSLVSDINNILRNFSDFNESRLDNLNWLQINLNPNKLVDDLISYMEEPYVPNKEGLDLF